MGHGVHAIRPKSPADIVRMRAACGLAARTMAHVASLTVPGVRTRDLDAAAAAYIAAGGGEAAFLGYHGYPAHVCVSINEELIHGIPGDRAIRGGDIVSVDVGVRLDGFIGDVARTFTVGAVPGDVRRMVDTAREAFDAACAVLRAGCHVGDLSHAIQTHCERQGYGVVRDYVGHGVGRELHEPPQIPNVGERRRGTVIPAGATLAIEPMITLGTFKVKVRSDRWTVVTADGLPCAHYENTVLVTEDGCEILTVA